MALSQVLDLKPFATYVGIEHQSGLENIQLQLKKNRRKHMFALIYGQKLTQKGREQHLNKYKSGVCHDMSIMSTYIEKREEKH